VKNVGNVNNVNETSKMLETDTAEDIIATTPLNLSTVEQLKLIY
jgi:hypothetical protein